MMDDANTQDETREHESVENAFSAPEGKTGIGGKPDESIRTGVLDTHTEGSIGRTDAAFRPGPDDIISPRDVSEEDLLAGDHEVAGDLGTEGGYGDNNP